MKKLVVVLLTLMMVLSGCQAKKEIKHLKTTEVMKKMDNKESFILVVGASTCGACLAYKPVLEEVVKNKDVEIYYVEYDLEGIKADKSVDEAGKANIKTMFEKYFNNKVTATPTTLAIKDGKIVDMKEAVLEYVPLIEWLKEHGQKLK